MALLRVDANASGYGRTWTLPCHKFVAGVQPSELSEINHSRMSLLISCCSQQLLLPMSQVIQSLAKSLRISLTLHAITYKACKHQVCSKAHAKSPCPQGSPRASEEEVCLRKMILCKVQNCVTIFTGTVCLQCTLHAHVYAKPRAAEIVSADSNTDRDALFVTSKRAAWKRSRRSVHAYFWAELIRLSSACLAFAEMCQTIHQCAADNSTGPGQAGDSCHFEGRLPLTPKCQVFVACVDVVIAALECNASLKNV